MNGEKNYDTFLSTKRKEVAKDFFFAPLTLVICSSTCPGCYIRKPRAHRVQSAAQVRALQKTWIIMALSYSMLHVSMLLLHLSSLENRQRIIFLNLSQYRKRQWIKKRISEADCLGSNAGLTNDNLRYPE